MKKEVGKVVETSDVVRSQATREFRKRGKEPRSPKRSPKKGPKKFLNFKILNFKILRLSKVLWLGASVDVGFYCIFWRQDGKKNENVSGSNRPSG